jgi:hypothetical protein
MAVLDSQHCLGPFNMTMVAASEKGDDNNVSPMKWKRFICDIYDVTIAVYFHIHPDTLHHPCGAVLGCNVCGLWLHLVESSLQHNGAMAWHL